MKDYINNPKAGFDYEILDTIEGGIVLEGHEVKSIKTGKASIKGSYIKLIGEEPFLVGATISPYQEANTPKDYDPQRSRKLLLSKSQIASLIGKSKAEGLTLVPLKIYQKGKFLKILIGIARGRKKYDKREAIKKKEFERKVKRSH